jgi:hypothetical protein
VWLALCSNVAFLHAAVKTLPCCWVLPAFVPGRCDSWHAFVVGCQYSISGWAGQVLGLLLCGCVWDLQQQVGLQLCVRLLSLESDFTGSTALLTEWATLGATCMLYIVFEGRRCRDPCSTLWHTDREHMSFAGCSR